MQVAVFGLLGHRHACVLYSSVPCLLTTVVATDSCTAEERSCMWVTRVGHPSPRLTTAQGPWRTRTHVESQVAPDS